MKKGIILVSFGTSHNEARRLCIDSILNRIKEEYQDIPVLGAFTSQVIINILKKRDKNQVFNIEEALMKMIEDGINIIYVQPLFVLPGKEYSKLIDRLNNFNKENPDMKVRIGKPLLSDSLDYEKVVKGFVFLDIRDKEALVLMGHGSDPKTDEAYEKLENEFIRKTYNNVFIGTLKGKKTIDDIIVQLKAKGIRRVKLMPFMLLAGNHAKVDMVSGDDSWQGKLLSAGIMVEVLYIGLGQIKEIQDIYMKHLDDILNIDNKNIT